MRYSASLSVALFTLVPGLLASPFAELGARRPAQSAEGDGPHPQASSTGGVHTGPTGMPASTQTDARCRLFADAWLGQDWILDETCKGGKTTTIPMWMTEDIVYATARPSPDVNNQNRRRAQQSAQQHSVVGGPAQPQLTTVPVGKPATVIVCQSCPAGASGSGGPAGVLSSTHQQEPTGASGHAGNQPTGGNHDNKRFARP